MSQTKLKTGTRCGDERHGERGERAERVLVEVSPPNLVRNVLVFVQEHFQLAYADAQVPVGELIRNVEPQRPELPALNGISMK